MTDYLEEAIQKAIEICGERGWEIRREGNVLHCRIPGVDTPIEITIQVKPQ
jgi:hypothetical protein